MLVLFYYSALRYATLHTTLLFYNFLPFDLVAHSKNNRSHEHKMSISYLVEYVLLFKVWPRFLYVFVQSLLQLLNFHLSQLEGVRATEVLRLAVCLLLLGLHHLKKRV
jgi:hypothetical protein